MAIFDILKKELYTEGCDGKNEPIVEEENAVEGNAQALVDGMIENAPGSKEQIGIILKYAANSIPNYDIWDAALDYYESLGDEGTGDDEVAPTEEEPTDELSPEDEELPTEEPTDEEPPVEGDEEELSM